MGTTALLGSEIVSMATRLVCLLITTRTLREAIATRRIVQNAQLNHGADIWTLNSVRSKLGFTIEQIVSVIMGVDRLRLIVNHYHPDYWVRWIAFGWAVTGTGMLTAWIVWSNMRAYRKLRDS